MARMERSETERKRGKRAKGKSRGRSIQPQGETGGAGSEPSERMVIKPRFKSEAHFQRSVERAAKQLGWRTYHTRDSRGSNKGYPDLTLIKPGHRILFFELKTGRRKLTPEQGIWLADLNRCPGVRAYEMRESDWDTILDILQEAAA